VAILVYLITLQIHRSTTAVLTAAPTRHWTADILALKAADMVEVSTGTEDTIDSFA
jgi:hypothetical protein